MKTKTKEIHLILSLLAAIIIGFFLGQYFGLETSQAQCDFTAEEVESCNYERWIYNDICGEIEFLMDDNQAQECIRQCTSP